MPEHREVVFDQYVPAGTIISNGLTTSTKHNAQLGKHNILELHAVLDNITPDTASRNLMVFVQQSGDGINWLQRSNQLNSFLLADADIDLFMPASSTATLQGMWSDQCLGVSKIQGTVQPAPQTGPLLGLVRLYICFDNATTAGHLRVIAVARDA